MKCKHVSMCQDAALQQLPLYWKLQTVAHVVTLFALLVSRSSVKMIFFFLVPLGCVLSVFIGSSPSDSCRYVMTC